MSIVAQPGIDSLTDLKGKKIGTSSLTEGTAIYTQIVLASKGLHYPGDYDFAFEVAIPALGGPAGREIDSAPQPAPWNFLALDQGYKLIGEVNDFIPAIIGNASWLLANEDVVSRFRKAHRSARGTNNPKNQDEILPIFQRITTPV